MHKEMPRRYEGMFQGFQLCVNLPWFSKMMSPRYRDIRRDQIPSHSPGKGVEVKVIAGRIGSIEGPVKDLVVDADYLDVSLSARMAFSRETRNRSTAFA